MRISLLRRATFALSIPVVVVSLVTAAPVHADPPIAPLAFPIDGYMWA